MQMPEVSGSAGVAHLLNSDCSAVRTHEVIAHWFHFEAAAKILKFINSKSEATLHRIVAAMLMSTKKKSEATYPCQAKIDFRQEDKPDAKKDEATNLTA